MPVEVNRPGKPTSEQLDFLGRLPHGVLGQDGVWSKAPPTGVTEMQCCLERGGVKYLDTI